MPFIIVLEGQAMSVLRRHIDDIRDLNGGKSGPSQHTRKQFVRLVFYPNVTQIRFFPIGALQNKQICAFLVFQLLSNLPTKEIYEEKRHRT